MGRVKINEFGDGGFARGDEVYANDGAILAESMGACDPIINVNEHRSYSMMSIHWAATDAEEVLSGSKTAVGTEEEGFRYRFPRASTLVHYHMIAFNDSTGGNNYNFRINNAAAVDNTVVVELKRIPATETSDYSTSVTVNESCKDFEAAVTITTKSEFAPDDELSITFKRSGHTAFAPRVQVHLIFKEDHSRG